MIYTFFGMKFLLLPTCPLLQCAGRSKRAMEDGWAPRQPPGGGRGGGSRLGASRHIPPPTPQLCPALPTRGQKTLCYPHTVGALLWGLPLTSLQPLRGGRRGSQGRKTGSPGPGARKGTTVLSPVPLPSLWLGHPCLACASLGFLPCPPGPNVSISASLFPEWRLQA